MVGSREADNGDVGMGARSEANGCAVIAQIEVASPVWADFSLVLALETVYGTDAGSKANDDGASRWCGFPHAW